jgi:hypothetical protein
MATINKNISPEERQANIDALINYLVTSKRELIAEMQEDFKKPAFQAELQKLREKNARRRKTTEHL